MSLTNKIRGVLMMTAVTACATLAMSPLDAEARWGWKKPGKTVAGIVAASGGDFDRNARDYDLLLNALQAANLVGALDDPSGSFTVLAPNDGAFIRLAQDLGYDGNDEEARSMPSWAHSPCSAAATPSRCSPTFCSTMSAPTRRPHASCAGAMSSRRCCRAAPSSPRASPCWTRSPICRTPDCAGAVTSGRAMASSIRSPGC